VSDDALFDLDPVAAGAATMGARLGLLRYGIEADEEICSQVAISVLCAFVSHGGLNEDNADRLRDLVVTALMRVEQGNGH